MDDLRLSLKNMQAERETAYRMMFLESKKAVLLSGQIKEIQKQIQILEMKAQENFLLKVSDNDCHEELVSKVQAKLKRMRMREKFEVREERLTKYSNQCRRALVEVYLAKDSDKYEFKVYRDNQLFDCAKIPKWDTYKIRRVIDWGNTRSRVPWKQINSGETWRIECELSPYYMDGVIIPQNVLSLKQKS